MPYTPPAQRSPAASTPNSPHMSRRSSYQSQSLHASHGSTRPDLPRSTSYLNKHRRTTSLKSPTFTTPSEEPTPPGTADREKDDSNILLASGSLRQSPPPVKGETQLPAGVVISPPDSTENSTDDEETNVEVPRRPLELENLAELQAAVRTIEQQREASPTRQAEQVTKANQLLTLLMPDPSSPNAAEIEESSAQVLRKISHNRSNTDSQVFVDIRGHQTPETPLTASDEDSVSDENEPERSRRKPPMLRKKSGELVRPALRPSSARRRPSSAPGTPTFSKAVHFDSHLEHVRHFLMVDRPLAVSANSSPVEQYDSDTEFPFNDDNGRSPPFEWEIIVSNFPAETPLRLSLPVRVERVFLSSDNKTLVGSVAVQNLAFNKYVVARFTLDYWKTTSEVVAEFNHDVRQPKNDGYDRFNFNIKLADQANLEAKTMFFCVKYSVNGQEYWDNNNSTNFQIDFRKKHKPQNGKKGRSGTSRSAHGGLPRSNKKSSSSGRPKSMPAAFDDFADGFGSEYSFEDFKKPVGNYLGESNPPIRLKGVKSAVNISNDTRNAPQPNGQAFGNRYDFGASLTAAMHAANSAMGDRSGLTPRTSGPKQQTLDVEQQPRESPPSAETSPLTMVKLAPKATQQYSAAPAVQAPVDGPPLASQSYTELLDKYCFFGSVKSSPQLKDGTLRTGHAAQYDGSNDEGYILESAEGGSPLPYEGRPTQASRSASPAPMTGPNGMSSMYYNLHAGLSFNNTHTPTAIRG